MKPRSHPVHLSDSPGRGTLASRVLAGAGAACWTLSPDALRVHEVDPSYEAFWGLSEADLRRDPLDFLRGVHPEDRESVRALLPLQVTGRYAATYRILRGRAVRWVHDRSILLREPGGAVESIARLVQETSADAVPASELRQVESALRESELRYRRLSEAAFEGVAVHRNGVILDCNEALARMFGYADHELIGRSALDLTAPESRDVIARAIATGREHPYRAVGIRKDGAAFPVEIRGRAAAYGGVPVRIAVLRDLSGEERAEEKLEQNATMLAGAERIGELGTFAFDPASDRLRWSEGLSAVFGLPPGSGPATETEFLAWVHPEDRQLVVGQLRRALASGEPVEFEERVRVPDGRELVLRSLAVAVTEPDRPPRVVGICKNVTELRTAEALDERKRILLEALAGASRHLAAAALNRRAVLDELTKTVSAHLAPECMVLLLDSTQAHLELAAFVHRGTEDADRLRELLADHPPSPVRGFSGEMLRTGRPFRAEDSTSAEAGQRMEPVYREFFESASPRSLMMVPLRGRRSDTGIIGVSQPAEQGGFSEAEQHFLEALAEIAGLALESAVRFEDARAASEAKSRFLALASHELRTPLSIVLGYVDLLMMDPDDGVPAPIRPELQRIHEAALQLTAVVERVLRFAGRDPPRPRIEPVRFDAWEVVGRAAQPAAERAAAAGLTFELDLPGEAAPMTSDPECLSQLLEELLANAVSFTDEGSVRVSGTADAHDVQFVVEDTGRGIPPELVERVFDPFWQEEHPLTRTVEGVGLGLALVRRVAEALGASVTHEPNPGGGSRFTVRLPRDRGWIAGKSAGA
jgi:PAS domain S-box-containing protein